jgi:hypothetical protein
MLSAKLHQPWTALVAGISNKNVEIKAIPDTETFKKGEAIVIGGQSKWNTKHESPNRLWYDSADTAKESK